MALAVIHSRAAVGVEAPAVVVEVHLANGLPALSIVGLPEAAVRESKDRVRSALITCGFEFPNRRITVNLAPADLPKEGGRFDLPIALGILKASGQLKADLDAYEFAGELGLDGSLRPVAGVLPMAVHTRAAGRRLIVPACSAAEGALVHAETFGARHLLEVCSHLAVTAPLVPAAPPAVTTVDTAYDLAEVKGQQPAKRALEVAAAGGHSLLLVGPPGTGKSMLAARLPGILPPMTEAERLEAAAIASVSEQGFRPDQWGHRPLRTPHHSSSDVALIGGGVRPKPGEISLAHHGVLFLDELPEFGRRALEALREPLETGRVAISRAAARVEYPARFQLVAAMNPCPCGFFGDPDGRCRCTTEQVDRYRNRLSGPLLDRIDLIVEVPRLPAPVLRSAPLGEDSATVRQRVSAARERQNARGAVNAALAGRQLDEACRLDRATQQLLDQAVERLRLSARGYHRILRVARTIADLAASEAIQANHLLEAINYRRMPSLA
ncbi:MAG TPA: YifB family Mg chelatase-like AAA ATPase [Gammaproteobacteria bacterium]|nr:YifB family Mg chelatase-like AAA ATPase [Gammaproteobacteria bacterium]